MSLKGKMSELFIQASSNVRNSFFQSEVDESRKYLDEEVVEFLQELDSEGIKSEYVDNFGGEGQGDEYWSVYKFSKDDEIVHIKFNGWYQSYNGSEFDSIKFVEPKQVMVTKYE